MSGWWAAAFIVQWVLVAVLAVVVVALARQIGVLQLRLAPLGALEVDDEGPPLGEAPEARAARTPDGSSTRGRRTRARPAGGVRLRHCPICEQVAPSLPAAARASGLELQVRVRPRSRGAYRVPGVPFVVVLDELGLVRSKGTVNSLEQVEGSGRHARGVETSRSSGPADGGRRARRDRARAPDEPSFVPRQARPDGRRGRRGSMVAVALDPDRAEAHHICGHLYTTESCPHPYAPHSRTDAYGFPVHPQLGYPVDDDGEIYLSERQTRRKVCQTVVPEQYPFVPNPRYGGGWSRCCNGRVRHIQDCCSTSDTGSTVTARCAATARAAARSSASRTGS